jgi:hypothetical protein
LCALWESKSFWFDATVLGAVAFLFATLIVVIGLIGEARKSSLQWFSWHPIFEILVIIGVAGEMLSDGTILLASLRMDTISDREIANVTLQAEQLRLLISGPRLILDGDAFVKALANKPKADVEILYDPAARDGWIFAEAIKAWLTQAKWDSLEPRAIKSTEQTNNSSWRNVPVGGAPWGVSVVAPFPESIDRQQNTPQAAVAWAIWAGMAKLEFPPIWDNPSIPKGTVRVVVGLRP